MDTKTTQNRRWGLLLGAAAIAAVGLSVAPQAQAYGGHGGGGWHGGYGGWRGGYGGWRGYGYGPGITLGLGGYYPYGYGYGYAPPPVYYAPATTYYAQPSYYYPSAVTTQAYTTHTSTVRHHVVHKAKAAAVCPIPASPGNSSSQTNY
jgi:hypothetical protein